LLIKFCLFGVKELAIQTTELSEKFITANPKLKISVLVLKAFIVSGLSVVPSLEHDKYTNNFDVSPN